MKLAELFAEISFKVNGADDLKQFDEQLKSIAASARDALLSLRALARVTIPKEFIPKKSDRGTPRSEPSQSIEGASALPNAKAPIGESPKSGDEKTDLKASIRYADIHIQNARISITNRKTEDSKDYGSKWSGVIPSAASATGEGLGSFAKFGLGLLGITSLIGVLKSLLSGIKDMVQSSRVAASSTDKLTLSTGLTRRELKQWEHLGSKANLSPGVIEDTLQRLTANREAMRYGRGNFAPFAQFGIDWTADAGTQLRQFFKATAGDTQAQAEQKAQLLGIDPSIVYARKFSENYNSTQPRAELSPEEYRNIEKLNADWQEMTFNAGVLASKLTADLAPAIRVILGLITAFEKFLTFDTDIWEDTEQTNSKDTTRRPITDTVKDPGYSASSIMAEALAVFKGMLPEKAEHDNAARINEHASRTVDITAIMPKPAVSNSSNSVNIETNVTNHGTVPEVLKHTGKTVTRVVSDAFFGVHPAFANR